jgi:uncharacterized membrane protein YqaE (UPF0057 family)
MHGPCQIIISFIISVLAVLLVRGSGEVQVALAGSSGKFCLGVVLAIPGIFRSFSRKLGYLSAHRDILV